MASSTRHPAPVPPQVINRHDVEISAGGSTLQGNFDVPSGATGVVIFAHGSGSSRFSPRNRLVASALHSPGLATLLMDLLTPAEEQVDLRTRQLRFDIGLLADRLVAAVDWTRAQPDIGSLGVGLFGASTGAAAALVAAAKRVDTVKAVVSRGGRPDLAEQALPLVKAPTLLIVGADDGQVLELNEVAQRKMTTHTEISVISGATHLFEEPGTLDTVANLAAGWFSLYL